MNNEEEKEIPGNVSPAREATRQREGSSTGENENVEAPEQTAPESAPEQSPEADVVPPQVDDAQPPVDPNVPVDGQVDADPNDQTPGETGDQGMEDENAQADQVL